MSEESEQSIVKWYRVPLAPGVMRSLNQRSNARGLLHMIPFLGLLCISGGLAICSAARWPWPLTLSLILVHGTFYGFTLNAFHELCHGTVFRSKRLNVFFLRLISFISLRNYVHFTVSHREHHRFTLHPPHDLEVVLPIRYRLWNFLATQFVNPKALWDAIRETVRHAAGRLEGEWEHRIFPDSRPTQRNDLFSWARFTLIGHTALVGVSIYYGQWMIPVVVTLARFYGEWLMFLCNNTQHVGLQDNVDDFRLCCRTVLLNPLLRFLYWHMNYHIEHHMYAAVPFYNLGTLHARIEKDLPPSPRGLVESWREIAGIMQRQDKDPGYQFVASLPQSGE